MPNPFPRRTDHARSTPDRRTSSFSSLVLAGAISFSGIFTANHAWALAGTLTASGATTTPRENSGAAGGATLIRTAASSTASSETASTQQVTGPTDSSSSTTRTSGGTRRRAQTEEGGGTRHRTGGGTARASTGGGGKTVVDNKDRKQVAPVPAPPKVQFTLSSGFETRYIYHGLDIVSFDSKLGSLGDYNNNNTHSSGIIYENADVSYAGAHLGVSYLRALSPTYPYYQSPKEFDFYNAVAVTDKTPGDESLDGTTNHRRFFQEVDVNLDYTLSVVAGWLDVTAGYDSYFFPYRDFRGISYQGNLFTRLAFTRIKYITPSFNYFHYFAKDEKNTSFFVYDTAGDYVQADDKTNASGSYVEFRIDGAIPLIERPQFGLSIAPYVAAGYNINYLRQSRVLNGSASNPNAGFAAFTGAFEDVGGWNDLECGIRLTARIGKHFTVTPYGNYGVNLSDNDVRINNLGGSTNTYGESTRFWGGVTIAYSF